MAVKNVSVKSASVNVRLGKCHREHLSKSYSHRRGSLLQTMTAQAVDTRKGRAFDNRSSRCEEAKAGLRLTDESQ